MQCINSSNLRGNLSDISRHQSEHHDAPPRGMAEVLPLCRQPLHNQTETRKRSAQRAILLISHFAALGSELYAKYFIVMESI